MSPMCTFIVENQGNQQSWATFEGKDVEASDIQNMRVFE